MQYICAVDFISILFCNGIICADINPTNCVLRQCFNMFIVFIISVIYQNSVPIPVKNYFRLCCRVRFQILLRLFADFISSLVNASTN